MLLFYRIETNKTNMLTKSKILVFEIILSEKNFLFEQYVITILCIFKPSLPSTLFSDSKFKDTYEGFICLRLVSLILLGHLA